jgi:hypothetical protein
MRRLAEYRTELSSGRRDGGASRRPEQVEAFRTSTPHDLLGIQKAIDAFELFIFHQQVQAMGPDRAALRFRSMAKDGAGQLEISRDTWLVSTRGAEKQEVSPEGVRSKVSPRRPARIFQFGDVSALSRLHKSETPGKSDMPWRNVTFRTRNRPPDWTGVALHAALDKYVHNLGQAAPQRVCIRLRRRMPRKL